MLWYCVSEMDNIQELMTKNISEVMERGERLDNLEAKSEELRESAKLFSHSAGKLAGRKHLEQSDKSEYSTGDGPAPSHEYSTGDGPAPLPRVQYW